MSAGITHPREHFLWIAAGINRVGQSGMWDEEDGFYYDVLRLPGRIPIGGTTSCSMNISTEITAGKREVFSGQSKKVTEQEKEAKHEAMAETPAHL